MDVGGEVGSDGGFGNGEFGGPFGDEGFDVLEAVVAGLDEVDVYKRQGLPRPRRRVARPHRPTLRLRRLGNKFGCLSPQSLSP